MKKRKVLLAIAIVSFLAPGVTWAQESAAPAQQTVPQNPEQAVETNEGGAVLKVTVGAGYDLRRDALLLAGWTLMTEEDLQRARLMLSFSFPTTSFAATIAVSPFNGRFGNCLQIGAEVAYFYKSNIRVKIFSKHLAPSDTAFSDPKASWNTTMAYSLPFIGVSIPFGSRVSLVVQSNTFWYLAWVRYGYKDWSGSREWGSVHGSLTFRLSE